MVEFFSILPSSVMKNDIEMVLYALRMNTSEINLALGDELVRISNPCDFSKHQRI